MVNGAPIPFISCNHNSTTGQHVINFRKNWALEVMDRWPKCSMGSWHREMDMKILHLFEEPCFDCKDQDLEVGVDTAKVKHGFLSSIS